MKKFRVNKYIKNQCKQIHTCKAVCRRREKQKKKKNHIIGIYYDLFDIYTLYIEKVDMNKKSQYIISFFFF